MRGPRAKVLTRLDRGLEPGQEAGEDDETIPMPELQHNLRLLLELQEVGERGRGKGGRV